MNLTESGKSRDVCSDWSMLSSTDEGDVCQKQRFLPDRRRPAERHGGARRPVLAGHSAAPPAHREGKNSLNSELRPA